MFVRKRHLKLIKERKVLPCILTGKFNFGICPICERKTLFLKTTEYLRGGYLCMFCGSIPRQRAIISVIEELFPNWRELKIHESSPGENASSNKLKKQCKHYIPTYYYLETPLGSYKNNIRCENLEKMTFEDESFDLVITQDVFEHIMNPANAFKEIARILKPKGAHIFTVPYYYWQNTVVRAVETPNGIQHLHEAVYHGNPIDKKGSLVVTDWGYDFVDFIYKYSKIPTTIYNFHDPYRGLEAKFLEVFVSRKIPNS